MKNLVLRSYNSRKAHKKFTNAGFGDQMHSIFCAFSIAMKDKVKINLHLDKNHCNRNKLENYRDILTILPANIQLITHDKTFKSNKKFLQYVEEKGYANPMMWFYEPRPADKFDPKYWFNIHPYLNFMFKYYDPKILMTHNIRENITAKKKFVTYQFDTTSAKRQTKFKKQILQNYKKKGYELISLEETASKHWKNRTKMQMKYLSQSDFHLGVDSGLMHMAVYFLPLPRIKMFAPENTKMSIHLRNLINNGVTVNENLHNTR